MNGNKREFEFFEPSNMKEVFDLWEIKEPLPKHGERVVVAFPGGAIWEVTPWGEQFRVEIKKGKQ